MKAFKDVSRWAFRMFKLLSCPIKIILVYSWTFPSLGYWCMCSWTSLETFGLPTFTERWGNRMSTWKWCFYLNRVTGIQELQGGEWWWLTFRDNMESLPQQIKRFSKYSILMDGNKLIKKFLGICWWINSRPDEQILNISLCRRVLASFSGCKPLYIPWM